MDCLPPLESAPRSLPMADYVAVALAELLLEDAPDRRVQLLDELLRHDPPLLLWAVLRSGRWREAPPDTTREVAQWLVPRLLDLLRWPTSSSASDEPDAMKRGAAARFGKLAGERVSQACATQQAATDDVRYLSALLTGAERWFPGEPATSSPQPISPSIPGWLAGSEAPPAIADDERSREAGKAVERKWKHAPLEGRGGALLRSLVVSLRRLHDLESNFTAQLEREKLDSLKELAYGASHEINNPLANISTRAQTLLRDETDAERRKKLATINSQAFRAHEMIADMMLFARPPKIESAEVDLNEVVADVLAELRDDAAQQGTRLVFETPGERSTALRINADGGQLRVALKAVVQNSLEAIGGGGRVTVDLEQSKSNGHPPGGEQFRIVVSDTGPGITPEVRRHLFDPFYSGREAGRGLGFGLSKAWRIVTAHQGLIEVDSEPGRGATIVLCLPSR